MTTPIPLTVPPPSAPVLVLDATAWAAARPASFTGEQARSWLIRNGTTKQQAGDEFLQVLNARRAAASAGTCTRREEP
ncbi:hypothetical protein [Micromonospora sp. NBC_00858]|uniref:hypothetical protein n=1 Tax=Micromonospora sp. NBC_00858 TaxID=2975979 RepID=UPI00386E3925|nr:hypothetical protein OG990_10515 [Micromonospora sp. NBC_00858]